VAPGIVSSLVRRRYEAVVKSPNGKIMLPLTYATARASNTAFVLWTGMWHHPTTLYHRFTRPVIERIYRRSDAIVTYGDHVKAFVTSTSGVDGAKVFSAGQAVDPRRFEAVVPSRSTPPVALF